MSGKPPAGPGRKSKVVKAGDKRSKKHTKQRRMTSATPQPLPPDDFVKLLPISKNSEVGAS